MRYHQDSSRFLHQMRGFRVDQFNYASELCFRINLSCHAEENLQIFAQNFTILYPLNFKDMSQIFLHQTGVWWSNNFTVIESSVRWTFFATVTKICILQSFKKE